MDPEREIYPGSFLALMKHRENRAVPFLNTSAALPPVDIDLDTLAATIVEPSTARPTDFPKNDIRAKQAELQTEFAGGSALAFLHATLIAILRRDPPHPDALILFQRIWAEKGAELVQDMSVRWMISSATTFADHGQTGDQRACGMGLSVTFDLIKLHESERRLSGQPGRRPFRSVPIEERPAMPMSIQGYSFTRGDLDRNLLSRLWQLGERDPVIAPLARKMLLALMEDNRTVFARVQRIKKHGQA